LSFSGCGEIAARERPRPPILIVALDGVPVRMTGLGGPTDARSYTPVLDQLAQDGLVYTRCLAPEPWSDTSLALALGASVEAATGNAGQGVNGAPIEPLAARLKRAGWRTAAVLAHEGVATEAVLQGFDEVRRLGAGDEAGAVATDVVREALELFDRAPSPPPCVLVHFADPRPPHHRYRGLVAEADAPYAGPCVAGLPHAELLRLAPEFGPQDFERLAALIASEVAAVDVALGQLLDGLARRALSDELLVIVLGTRGAWTGRDGRVGLLPGVEPEVLHVPLVLRLPARITRARHGLSMRGEVDMPVTLLDLTPTILDALELTDSGDVRLVREGAATPASYSGAGRQRALAGRSPGRSILPGAPAPPRLLRVGTTRGHALAAVYGSGGALLRDLETGAERGVLFGAPLEQGGATSLPELAADLDAWLGPAPKKTPAPRKKR